MHVCLFDIDGTLLASGGAGKAAMETALGSAFGVTELRGWVSYSGRTDRAIARDLFHQHDIEEVPENWQRFLAAYLGHLPSFLASHQGRVLPGIISLLDRLRDREEIAVGLLTGNIRAGAQLKLDHYGLMHHFAFGGFGDHHLERDAVAQEALRATQDHLNGSAHPDRIWVIGDTPLDVRCARSIGARVAAVATGWHPAEELAAAQPDLLFSDLADPGPLLKRLGVG